MSVRDTVWFPIAETKWPTVRAKIDKRIDARLAQSFTTTS